ncbi:hypothetical protein [Echinicola shivajiensis]|uniref:hypothetical protein n=1 Tax=Echinicola shivajiensis TaxID=1035916 RepID=UPI001BFC69C8|nr:hypothetical protein [Echinicola shivajiensis]
MNFFEKIKNKLEDSIKDKSSIEHALIQRNNGKDELLIYRKQGLDGDCVNYQSSEKIATELIKAFNESFQASVISRNAIIRAAIEIFKN